MKLKSKVFIIIVLILTINQWFAIEKSSINLEKEPLVQNTDKNIKQAHSIEKEVTTFRDNVITIQKKYKLKNDKTINKSIKDLWEIIYILRKIQTTKINKNTADDVIKIVINDLKIIDSKTKNYLKNIKRNLENYRIKYDSIAKKLNYTLNKLTLSFIKHYKQKNKITSKDKKIIKIVQSIYKKSLKLKYYKNQNFYSKEDMKLYLVNILKSIKQDFKKIKEISKKR